MGLSRSPVAGVAPVGTRARRLGCGRTHFQHLRRKGAFFLTGPPPLQQRLAAAFGKDHEGLGRPVGSFHTLHSDFPGLVD